MSSSIDLTTFHPNNAEELFNGIVAEVVSAVGAAWRNARKTIEVHLQTVAERAFKTTAMLEEGTISKQDADFMLHGQELYLNNVLLLSKFLVYEIAQKALDAVFKVVKAAIKNITGIELNF